MEGKEHTKELVAKFLEYAENQGFLPNNFNTLPFENSISYHHEISYPGNWDIEEKIRHYIRWNALITVLKANKDLDLGGHISTYSSAATLYEVGFNHFFRAGKLSDMVYFQGHSSPGIYARSFLEGNLSEEQLDNFRQEINGKGLSSYPHPWLMPQYWQFPTVSMGLGPIMSIYQAHIMKYLEQRGLLEINPDRKIWMFCGDGEMDEPESMGSISLAAREKLDNLIFVINCNLQRLDGPVRGNSRIITELGSIFKAAGWNVVNLIWGRKWNDLIANDKTGALKWVMNNTVDGEYQNFKAKGGAYTRKHFFGKHPDALKLVENMSDQEIEDLNRGGHDPLKVFNAYKKAYECTNKPTVILAFTVKGYGIGSRQADNTTHQVKKLSKENLRDFVKKFNLPIDEKNLDKMEYLKFDKNCQEYKYLISQRKKLGGFLPKRDAINCNLKVNNDSYFKEFNVQSKRDMSTTMVFVKLITSLLRDEKIGKNIVPIVPDEARTFGMDSLFRQFGIYSREGQKYQPEDVDKVMWYRESEDGVMLEEGINEAGAFSAWIALATSYANNSVPMVPFYIYYSMFGFQRIHDLAWAAGDARARGFLLGATSGRTTLNGEGLQHQDGHSHLLAQTIPNCKSYDPCFDYELATIIKNGIDDMYVKNNDNYYYLTLMNENYLHPERPKNLQDTEIMQGAYLFKKEKNANVRILASGLTLRFAIEASHKLLALGVSADVWSITSFNELARGGIISDQHNKLDMGTKSYVESCFENELPTVAVSEYQKLYCEQIRKWVNGNYICLGTDGFGRSDTREKLREFFEIDANHVAYNALLACELYEEAKKFKNKYKIKLNKKNPYIR
ncbi:pyruvate dehydrogenase (acetyl-transferring), homodimeric type, partial [Gammaproteobacteria bacterium]|nr:pyruvate dehydrogenase (acetyl-transferring), homodimeric type [Gammaproteobacteria bacterium]